MTLSTMAFIIILLSTMALRITLRIRQHMDTELSVIITKCRYAECSATCKGTFGGAFYMLKISYVPAVIALYTLSPG